MLLLLLACSTLETTGEDGLVGRIVDHEGVPVADLRISSVEGDARTDGDGRFAVNWKAPEQHVRFKWGPVSITRGYHHADAGRTVELTLPEPRDVTVACPPTPCDLVAHWTLADDFEATFRTRCKVAGAQLQVPGLPSGEPKLTCTVGKGSNARALPLMASDQGDVLGFRPARTKVRIDVRGAKDCEVRYGDELATRQGKSYEVEVDGPAVVTAVCGDRPARPVRLDPEVRDRVTLLWAADGPSLAAAGGTVDLVAEASDGSGWTLRLPDVDGTRALPPLTKGSYRLVHLPEGTAQALVAAPPEGEAGVVVWAPQEDGSRVGRLVVSGELAPGPLKAR